MISDMANKPVPRQLKILRGNPGKRALPKDEPTPEAVKPEPPKILSRRAKAHWRQVIEYLYDAKLMTNLDIDALTVYCEAFARWSEANDHIKKEGIFIYGSPDDDFANVPRQNPWLSIQQKAYEKMKSMLIEFGMTPSARTRVRTVGGKKEDDDGWGDA